MAKRMLRCVATLARATPIYLPIGKLAWCGETEAKSPPSAPRQTDGATSDHHPFAHRLHAAHSSATRPVNIAHRTTQAAQNTSRSIMSGKTARKEKGKEEKRAKRSATAAEAEDEEEQDKQQQQQLQRPQTVLKSTLKPALKVSKRAAVQPASSSSSSSPLSSSSSSSLPSTSAASAASAASTGKVKRDKHAVRIDKNATNIVFGNISHYNDIERFSSLYNKLKRKGNERDNEAWKDAIADMYEVRVKHRQCTYTSCATLINNTYILRAFHRHCTCL